MPSTPSVKSNYLQTPAPPLAVQKSCCTELIERIQTIWKSICGCISDLANRLLSWICPSSINPPPSRNLAVRCPNAFHLMTRFLTPIELADYESICKSWSDKHIWQVQAISYGMTVPKDTKPKDLFKTIHATAFGKKAWQKHLEADPGITPPLPAQVYKTFQKLQATHILTLIPATIDKQPTNFHTFIPVAKKMGITFDFWGSFLEKFGNDHVAKSVWVWMRKEIVPESRGILYSPAPAEEAYLNLDKAYPNKLGKSLYYTICLLAHFARHKICLLPLHPEASYTHTCNRGVGPFGPWSIIVGGFTPTGLSVRLQLLALRETSVACLFPAEDPNPDSQP